MRSEYRKVRIWANGMWENDAEAQYISQLYAVILTLRSIANEKRAPLPEYRSSLNCLDQYHHFARRHRFLPYSPAFQRVQRLANVSHYSPCALQKLTLLMNNLPLLSQA